ncbi:MAG: helix-turn-helix domain-containing protein [Acidobacteria bacterium]|nr:helix-turn-helix domain-containing protein [Acidobacteriota bacterium]
MESELMTIDQAARYLSIAKPTLYHWVSDRRIPFVKMGRLVRFRRCDLDRFILKNLRGRKEIATLS